MRVLGLGVRGEVRLGRSGGLLVRSYRLRPRKMGTRRSSRISSIWLVFSLPYPFFFFRAICLSNFIFFLV